MHYPWVAAALALHSVWASAPSGPWDAFNYAPKSKTVWPAAIHRVEGTVDGATNLVDNEGPATLAGNGSWLTLDYGVEVGGLISITFISPAPSASLALSFTESPLFISPLTSDDSSYPAPNMSYDGVLRVPAPLPSGWWTQPASALRGGFRYLTLVSTSSTPLTISNVSCAISFMPHVDDLRDYAGYFYAQDSSGYEDPDFLTKVWYAGAYTVQTNTVPLDTGREVPFVSSPGWANNATLGVAGPIIVDGAKRDRAVWPGDMGIAVPTQFVSTYDLLPTRNALSTMFAALDPLTGALPESGPPLSQTVSDTYHAWTLIGTYNYYMYSGDTAWLQNVWANYTKAVGFLEGKVDSTGLMNVTGLRDWARLGGGGHNAEGNALFYKVLTNSASLASYADAPALSSAWSANATALKSAFNAAFWDPQQGMYRDNTSTTLCPQDANSMAILFNLTTSAEQAGSVSKGLERNWNALGAVAPELPDTISPFIGGLELQAHFESGNDARAMDLLHREWGYMLATNLSVQSTLLEGFTANGSLSYRGYNYDPSYTSHAHGWSSGPTSALTFYVLGLTITAPQGRTWSVAPHPSGLPRAEGGFSTGLGWFGVKWWEGEGGFTVEVDVPEGTQGVVRLPYAVEGGKVCVNGVEAHVVEGVVNVVGGKSTVVLQR
ncbi:Six-hairpin glycosidase [Gloeophyllum trabeum ATCC 11539]|uniref:Six-hairpin glycosidase n=1 Tax=Gloeophyllum trabeum (strain ATCC 11539 / FP-39264 / Madison 617) TaxID=670483 RepID=S7RRV0_GLOTA|nr:Six-hairpin glycosidase [Gloeophyllum trabeum ATCC 11539]EPQ55724.1 Six-hairpin glycosidase [Gloeophyllum trabeum ATCC 11539]